MLKINGQSIGELLYSMIHSVEKDRAIKIIKEQYATIQRYYPKQSNQLRLKFPRQSGHTYGLFQCALRFVKEQNRKILIITNVRSTNYREYLEQLNYSKQQKNLIEIKYIGQITKNYKTSTSLILIDDGSVCDIKLIQINRIQEIAHDNNCLYVLVG